MEDQVGRASRAWIGVDQATQGFEINLAADDPIGGSEKIPNPLLTASVTVRNEAVQFPVLP